MKPLIEEVEETTFEKLADAERFWISQFRALGFPLTNGTEGGDGLSGRTMSSESRLKLSKAKLGIKFTAAHRRAMELSRPGRPVVDDLGNVYGSAGAAARAIGVDRAAVRRVLVGKQKTTLGRTFRFKEES